MGANELRIRVGDTVLNGTPVPATTLNYPHTATLDWVFDWPESGRTSIRGPVEWNFTSEEGYEFGWVPLSMGPLTAIRVDGLRHPADGSGSFVTGDTFTLDINDSLDVDGTITEAQKVLVVDYYDRSKNASWASVAIETQPGQWLFDWDAVDAFYDSLSLPEPTGLYLQVAVTDNDGHVDSDFVTVTRPETVPRARFIVRPSGDIIKRDKSILWQHPGQARIWAGEPKTGTVLSSDDEGTTWTIMAEAWNDIASAKPLDFEELPENGACSIAKVGTQIVFRLSHDGVVWETPVPVCAAGTGVSSWCVRSHLPSGSTTLSVSDMKLVRYVSHALGEVGSWVATTL